MRRSASCSPSRACSRSAIRAWPRCSATASRSWPTATPARCSPRKRPTDAFRDEAFAALAQGAIYEKSDCQFRRRDGSLFWARMRASAVMPGRREAGTIWIVEDVSETRQARRELQALMNNASLAIMFTHATAHPPLQRAAFARCSATAAGECEGLPVQRPASEPGRLRARWPAPAYPLFAQGRTYQAEVDAGEARTARRSGAR